jgi:hypothetical protein
MTARHAIACLAAIAVAGWSPVTARAQDEGGPGRLSRLHYGVEGGYMSGIGPQGQALGRGPSFSLNLHGDSPLGMELGIEAAYASSNDVLNTRFASLGGIARLSPTPEDYRAYVQLGAGLCSVTFSPDAPGVSAPANSVRPGGSFGVGLELIERTNVSVGVIVQYHGVVLARSEARSYLIGGISLTFKPSPY